MWRHVAAVARVSVDIPSRDGPAARPLAAPMPCRPFHYYGTHANPVLCLPQYSGPYMLLPQPANVLFTTDWRLLVADFGVSINLHHERAVTRAGTEGYMAPEVERCPLKAEPQENKDKPQLAYSTAVDIWAVGCMAYELMVGFPPAIAPQRQHAPAGAGPTGAQNADGGPGCGVHTQLSVQFPATVPQDARDFICAAVAPDPRTRPTAAQLLASAWLQGREDATDAGTDAGVAGDP